MAQAVVPFGFGVGDVFDAGKFIINLVGRVRDSPDDHKNASLQAEQFSKFLDVLRDDERQTFMSSLQRKEITAQLQCGDTLLRELRDMLQHHASLATTAAWTTSRVTWSQDKADDVRSRMIAFVVTMQPVYNAYVQQGAQRAVLDALDVLRVEMKAGLRRTPSISSVSQKSQHDDQNINSDWHDITTGLEQLGITSLVAVTHKEMILRYFQNALSPGVPISGQSSTSSINPKVKIPAHSLSWIQDQYAQTLQTRQDYDEQRSTPLRYIVELFGIFRSWVVRVRITGYTPWYDTSCIPDMETGCYLTDDKLAFASDGLSLRRYPTIRPRPALVQVLLNRLKRLSSRPKESRSDQDLPPIEASYHRGPRAPNRVYQTCITAAILLMFVLPTSLIYMLISTGHMSFDDINLMAASILVSFTLLFGLVISAITNAKRHELFAASAAYCAMLIFFMSNVPVSDHGHEYTVRWHNQSLP